MIWCSVLFITAGLDVVTTDTNKTMFRQHDCLLAVLQSSNWSQLPFETTMIRNCWRALHRGPPRNLPWKALCRERWSRGLGLTHPRITKAKRLQQALRLSHVCFPGPCSTHHAQIKAYWLEHQCAGCTLAWPPGGPSKAHWIFLYMGWVLFSGPRGPSRAHWRFLHVGWALFLSGHDLG